MARNKAKFNLIANDKGETYGRIFEEVSTAGVEIDLLVNNAGVGNEELTVTSNSFESDGAIPIQYTGRGEDISPFLKLSEISEGAKSLAIIMDDLDVPLIGTYNHWVIWNVPIQDVIPEAIPHGVVVESGSGRI